MNFDYIKDPEAIYARSFELVRSSANVDRIPVALRSIAIRVVHACGMPDVIDDLVFSDDVVSAGVAALGAGAPILADCEMVRHGITQRRLPSGNAVRCHLNDERVPGLAKRLGTTRSAAAVELWRDELAGALVVIGNAPTALFHLLERLHTDDIRPAAIIAFPVGFVGAAESKAALAEHHNGIPFMTLKGRRGGSAMAAAVVNALASAG
ncbi:MAG: precorrin-8X methylmutase [Pseudomonadota bacterium]